MHVYEPKNMGHAYVIRTHKRKMFSRMSVLFVCVCIHTCMCLSMAIAL